MIRGAAFGYSNQWHCRGFYIPEKRVVVTYINWRCSQPGGPFYGGLWYDIFIAPDGVCWAANRAGVFAYTATPERPPKCPIVGNPIQVNSQEKLQRETDYASPTLRFDRYYGSEKTVSRPGSSWSHSFADFVSTHATTIGQHVADGTVVRFGLSPLQPLSADTRTTIVETTATADGQVRWTITALNEARIDQFDYSGRILQRRFADGRSVRFTYIDANGARVPATAPACQMLVNGMPVSSEATRSTLQCVTDDYGRQLNFRYAAPVVDGFAIRANLLQMIDPAGNVYQYAYDEATSNPVPGRPPVYNLTSVMYPDGYRLLYHYNEPANTANAQLVNALTGVSEVVPTTQPFRLSTFKYDTQGRAIYTERAGGINAYSVNYAVPRRETVITDPLGTQRRYTFTKLLGVERVTGSTQPAGAGSGACADALAYDANGNVSSRIDFNGNKTCYAFDLNRNLETRRVEGLSANTDCVSALTSPPAGARIISTQWHPDWRMQTRIAEPNRITTITYNGQGATCAPSTVLVDGKSPAVICSRAEQATTDPSGALGFGAGLVGTARTWSYTYATYGRVLTATDPNGKITTTMYYPDDDPDAGRRGMVALVTNAVNLATQYSDYNLHGQPTRIVAPNGLVTLNSYDARLRLRSQSVGSELTVFDYHPAGHLLRITMPDGATTTYGYDNARRLTSIQDQLGNRISYTLDGMGNRVSERIRIPAAPREERPELVRCTGSRPAGDR